MRRPDEADTLRRELLRALSLGAFAGLAGWSSRVLPAPPASAGRSVHRLRGEVLVNGRRIGPDDVIRSNDSIRTGSNSLLVATVSGNAYLLRENSMLEMSGDRASESLKLIAGKLMAVFGRERAGGYRIRTVTATVGIRGTGVYAEAYEDRTYLCTCYGSTELVSATDPRATERITSKHHDAPRWILAEPEQGRYIVPAAVNNHTDEEVDTLNALVGRKGWYSSDPAYERPRREY